MEETNTRIDFPVLLSSSSQPSLLTFSNPNPPLSD